LSLNKECGTNSSETSNIIGNGFGKPHQHVLLGFGEVCGRAGDLVYYFDARNGKVNEGYVRNVFKQLLYVETVNANNETVGSLTAQGVEIFNIIWGQSVLRGNLFPDINFSQTDNIIKPIGLKQFKDKIASLSDSFYKFIKVK
jgi:hypothetical protein